MTVFFSKKGSDGIFRQIPKLKFQLKITNSPVYICSIIVLINHNSFSEKGEDCANLAEQSAKIKPK